MPGNRASASSAAYWAETSVSRDCPLQVIENTRKTRWSKPPPQHRPTEPNSIPPTHVSRKVSFSFPLTAASCPWRCKRSSGGAHPWVCQASDAAVPDFLRAKTGTGRRCRTLLVLFFSRGILGIVKTGLTRSERALLHSARSSRTEPPRAGRPVLFPFSSQLLLCFPAPIFRSFLAPTFAPDDSHRSAGNRRPGVDGGAVRHQDQPFFP